MLRRDESHPEVSPTDFRHGEYRCWFFSREEARMHVHVHHETGEAKIWMEPEIEVAECHGLSSRRLSVVLALAKERAREIRDAWNEHFSR